MLRTILFSFVLMLTTAATLFSFSAMAAESQTVTLDIPGMTCKFCPITIRKALKKVPGVIEAKAGYATKTATVTFDPDRTNIKALIKATSNAGYPSTLKK